MKISYHGIIWLPTTIGRFTQTSCRWGNCVQQNHEGTWCYIPKAGQTALLNCTGAQADLSGVIDVHLRQGASVAYYRGVDDSQFQGGANWPVPAVPGMIRICVSGISEDGVDHTMCMNIQADNSIIGDPYCQVAIAPALVTDGCYNRATSNPFTSVTSVANIPIHTDNNSPLSSLSSIGTFLDNLPSSTTIIASSLTTNTRENTANSAQKPDTNVLKNIIAPLIVATLGLIAALVGGGRWKKTQYS